MIAPPWMKPGGRDQSMSGQFEWKSALGPQLGHVAGLVHLTEFQTHFLEPILDLEGDNCWNLLSPITSTFVCTYVYDALTVPCDSIAMLDLCVFNVLSKTLPSFAAPIRADNFQVFTNPNSYVP